MNIKNSIERRTVGWWTHETHKCLARWQFRAIAYYLNRLRGSANVAATARELSERLRGFGQSTTGFVVQRMADSGVEMLIGVVHDPQFGPVVACGAGGVQVD